MERVVPNGRDLCTSSKNLAWIPSRTSWSTRMMPVCLSSLLDSPSTMKQMRQSILWTRPHSDEGCQSTTGVDPSSQAQTMARIRGWSLFFRISIRFQSEGSKTFPPRRNHSAADPLPGCRRVKPSVVSSSVRILKNVSLSLRLNPRTVPENDVK